MKSKISATISTFVANFAQFYHESRVKAENLRAVKYRIVTTLEEYQKNHLLELSFTDRPGDILPPMSVEQIKNTPDIIAYMHPIDVNSINDLYYLSRLQEEILEMQVFEDELRVIMQNGKKITYKISDRTDINTIQSPRVSYMLGYMQAEKLTREAYQENIEFRIVKDNIATLYVTDKSGAVFTKKPTDILFSGEYKKYSKEDVARIGHICGQMSNMR